MSKETDISEFLKPDFKTAKYFPIEENIEEKSEEIKAAWREIFAFAYECNRMGRKWNETDVTNLTQMYCTVIHLSLIHI